ncbi:DUF1641 domain-containing protein [Acidithiobacillus montserratensis]|uniref:DUF1641 domain-containing protein n=1 Tax=Acidithiobacillus montserratensis TaxID=2729135 RepID=A0ACD5HE49_9PROT|nr:DUF1641 domain-containing protein [Acidithiobacillus montserratensis]MBN2680314.1 DUF1641 domain-containing protein [Acidithiobacillaceae bacterium]MBU2747801.1 DUF1641 domain-containing protein [Acidithiobacillus montserratensis]
MAAQESFTPQLTPEQWAGLARLGDLAHGSASFMESPAGNLPMDLALKAGRWDERFNLEGSIEELLETLKVLRESGLLALIRENAAFLAESVELLKPYVPILLAKLHELPLAEWMSALQLLGEIVPKLNAVLEFMQGPAGGAVVAKVKELGDLWQETSADTTIVEALRLLKQLQEDGNLQRVADLSRQVGLFAETIDLESLVGQFVQQSQNSPVLNSAASLMQSGRLMAAALADAAEHEATGKAGGLSGLYHMLKDPDVQRGMRVVAVLPVYLEKAGVLPKHKG